MSITLFVPSKDRAPQLRILLQSIRDHLPVEEFDEINIAYKYSNEEFKRGYAKLRDEKILPNINWIYEFTSSQEMIDVICSGKEKYILLLTDDSLVYRYVPTLKPAIELLESHPSTLTFTLRLGHNTVLADYTHPERDVMDIDGLLQEHRCPDRGHRPKDVFTWNWKSTRHSHFSHAISLDGSIIRLEDLAMLTRDSEHTSYRQWECCVSDYVRRFDKNLHGCFEQSHVVTIPVNQVVDAGRLTDGIHYPRSPSELNEQYLHGSVIDYHSLLREAEYDVNTPLKEFPFTLRRSRWYDWWLGK